MQTLFTEAKAEKDKFKAFGELFLSIAARLEELKEKSADQIDGFMRILKADYEKLCDDAPLVLVKDKFKLVEDTTAFSVENSRILAEKEALQKIILSL